MVLYCDQFRALWNGLQTARCWSWMGKSIIEWKTDIQTYEDKKLQDEVKFLHMATRFLFAGRWFFENWMILVSSKVLRDNTKGGFWAPAPQLNKWAKKLWFSALVCGIVTEFAKLRNISKKREALEGNKKMSEKEKSDEMVKIKDDIYARYRTIVMHMCDSPVSISVGLGYALSHQTVGGLMTISSYIQCCNLWPK